MQFGKAWFHPRYKFFRSRSPFRLPLSSRLHESLATFLSCAHQRQMKTHPISLLFHFFVFFFSASTVGECAIISFPQNAALRAEKSEARNNRYKHRRKVKRPTKNLIVCCRTQKTGKTLVCCMQMTRATKEKSVFQQQQLVREYVIYFSTKTRFFFVSYSLDMNLRETICYCQTAAR